MNKYLNIKQLTSEMGFKFATLVIGDNIKAMYTIFALMASILILLVVGSRQ